VRRLFVICGVTVLLAACVARASGTPAPQLFSSSAQPVAGKRFPGLALVLPPQAQKVWTSFRATCVAWVAHRRLPGSVTAVPQGAQVPNAVVCSWRIPAGTTGKQLRARIATDVTWNDTSLEHAQGQLVTWTIQRR
jgi:hypothetical protein